LEDHVYNNFMALSVAIRILCSPSLHRKLNNYAEKLLLYFVIEFKNIYGKEFMSFNIHGLLHLANDSLNHGNLDDFSTFPFENALGHLKKMLRSPNKPLQQVARKLHLKQVDLLQEKLYNLSRELPQTEFDYRLFFKLQTPDWVLNLRNEKDVYFYTVNDKFVRVKKIRTKQGEGYDPTSNIYFECDVFKGNFVNMFTSPCDSV